MANFYGTARSNYFRVKVEADFLGWVESVSGLGSWCKDVDGVKYYAIYSDDGDSGCWPSWITDADGDDVEIDIPDALSKLLMEDEIVVLMEAGAEKLRYISGYAQAFNHTGECVGVSLDDIYAIAKAKFGGEPTDATY